MRYIRTLLPHAGIVLSLMFITFYVIDQVNPAMNFLGNDMSKTLLFILCLVTLGNCAYGIHHNRKRR